MGVDEARDDDVAGGIDRPGAVGGQVAADRGDPVVLDEDVGAGHLAELRVLGEDVSALDERSVGHRWSPLVLAPKVGRDCGEVGVLADGSLRRLDHRRD